MDQQRREAMRHSVTPRSGAAKPALSVPTACAVGYDLSPLRATSSEEKQCGIALGPVPGLRNLPYLSQRLAPWAMIFRPYGLGVDKSV